MSAAPPSVHEIDRELCAPGSRFEIETVDIQDFATQEAGEQVDLPPVTIFEGGNNTLTFVPNDDAPITEPSPITAPSRIVAWIPTSVPAPIRQPWTTAL